MQTHITKLNRKEIFASNATRSAYFNEYNDYTYMLPKAELFS